MSFWKIICLLHLEIGLKFTSENNGNTLTFLDIFKFLNKTVGTFETMIYRKPMATNNLLRWESWHPKALKAGISKGQFLPLRKELYLQYYLKK